jgi:hypothetical protein
LNGNPTRQPMNKATLAERAKYQFEAVGFSLLLLRDLPC